MGKQEQIDQFHAERLRGIGGSDVAVILGLSKWKTHPRHRARGAAVQTFTPAS